MKRNTKNRNGFTLVELLVVIAILAILATVSIVGYTNFINKANKSADEAAVTQMNIALQADEVTEKQDIVRVREVLSESGMDVDDYNALSSGCYFFWDNALNRVLYVEADDAADSYTVLYPEEYKGETYGQSEDKKSTNMKGHQWYTLSKTIETTDAEKNFTSLPSASSEVDSTKAGIYLTTSEETSVKFSFSEGVIKYTGKDANDNDVTKYTPSGKQYFRNDGVVTTHTYTCVIKDAVDFVAAAKFINSKAEELGRDTITAGYGTYPTNSVQVEATVIENDEEKTVRGTYVKVDNSSGSNVEKEPSGVMTNNTFNNLNYNLKRNRTEIVLDLTGVEKIDLMGADVTFYAYSEWKNYLQYYNVTIKGGYGADEKTPTVITGLEINGSKDRCALFGLVQNLTVENITIDGAVVGSKDAKKCAIFAGEVAGSAQFTNVTVTNSTVYAKKTSGILIGQFSNYPYLVTNFDDVELNVAYKLANDTATTNVSKVFNAQTNGANGIGTNKITLNGVTIENCTLSAVETEKTGIIVGAFYDSDWRNKNNDLSELFVVTGTNKITACENISNICGAMIVEKSNDGNTQANKPIDGITLEAFNTKFSSNS